MKIKKYLILAALAIGLLALTVASQIAQIDDTNKLPEFEKRSNFIQATDKINLEEKQDCTIKYYNESVNVYGYVPRFRDTYGTCFNVANQSNYTCVTGTEQYQSYEVIGYNLVLRNSSDCKTKSFVVSVNQGSEVEKKEIDFSSWGPCIQNVEDNCLVVTCVSLYDGAHNGKFTDCNGGKSCQKFQICKNDVKIFYKNSRHDFVEEDPTFYLDKLALKGVGK